MTGLEILSAVCFLTSGLAEGEATRSRLAVIRTAPDFALLTQTGQKLRLSDLKGKILLVSFIFTTCNGTCPATTHRMSQVQQELKTRGLCETDRVRLLSITLDPVRDTPEALTGYMRLYDIDILINGVGRPEIPICLGDALAGRQNVEALIALRAKEIPAHL